MHYIKWFCWVAFAIILMAGTNLTGCEGCEDQCVQAQMSTSMAWDEWQAAKEAHEAAVNNGADQATLDQLASEEMQAQMNHANHVQTMQIICGG